MSTGTLAEPREKTNPRAVQAALRRSQAVTLRVAGASYEQIGEQLGVSRQAAFKLVRRALAKYAAETALNAAELREVEARRLEARELILTRMLSREGLSDETRLRAIQAATNLSKHRCWLLGLNLTEPAPVVSIQMQQEEAMLPVIEGATDDELLGMLATFQAIKARKEMAAPAALPAVPVVQVPPEPVPVREPEPVPETSPEPPAAVAAPEPDGEWADDDYDPDEDYVPLGSKI